MVELIESMSDMSKSSPRCPKCQGRLAYKDGMTVKGKQRYRCRICGKSFIAVRDGINPLVAEIAAALLIEGIPVPTITKVMSHHCSRRWIYNLKASLVVNASR